MTQNWLETLIPVSKLLTFQLSNIRELETIKYAFDDLSIPILTVASPALVGLSLVRVKRQYDLRKMCNV